MTTQRFDHVVVEDPSNRFWSGAIVSPAMAHKLSTEKVTLLPVNHQLFKLNGVAGFVLRSWGSGWSMDAPVARPVCHAVLYAVPDHPVIHFAARLMPTEEARQAMENEEGGWKPSGTIRLITDTSQHNVMNGGLASIPETTIHVNTLGEPDEKGGWVVHGKANLNVIGEGYYGFALYGFVPGLRVAWLAISQTPG